MAGALDELRAKWAMLGALDHTGAVLGWDQQTDMPPGGAPARGRALAVIARLAHEARTSAEYGHLLDRAEAEVAARGLPDDEVRMLWRARRDFARAARLPADLIAELRELGVVAVQAWGAARAANDWPRFAPHLDRLIGLQRRMADFLGYDDHPYDALLDGFEPGMRTADVRRVFAELRERTAPLVRGIAARADAIDDAPLHRQYDEGRQWALAHDLSAAFGYDFDRGRIDRSTHPFTSGLARDDVRFTIRTRPDSFSQGFFAAAHECGHALHGQGIPAAFENTPLRGNCSNGIGESQSRLWENIVARGRPFLRGFFPRIQAVFPESLGDLDAEGFYRAANKAGPSLIRVEADEVTYNFHIMLRFDLELALLEGTIGVAELPARWNDAMEEYLGIRPATDSEGVLQDIHWSGASFGYFPTYALGNLMAVQLYDEALRDHPDLPARIEAGEFRPLLDWMRARIHTQGNKYPPQELLERATGSRLTAEPYIAYLAAKYGELYGLEGGE